MKSPKDKKSLLSLAVFLRTFPDLWQSAPWLVSLMAALTLVQGLIPAVTIVLSKWTVDGVATVARGGQADVGLLALAWASAALVGQLSVVVNRLVQGYVADHFTVYLTRKLMLKMQSLPGLDVVEDPRFYDDLELLQGGAARRPTNFVATSLWLFASLAGVAGVAATLATVAWWVPLAVVAGMLPLASRQMKLYELGFSITLQRTQEARELTYLQRVATRHEYAKEVRLYGLIPYVHRRYLELVRRYQGALRGARNRQLLGVLPMNLLSLAVTAGVFVYAVDRAAAGQLTVGGVVLVIAALAQMRDSLTASSEYVGLMTEHLLWFRKYHEFLDAEPRVSSPAEPKGLPRKLDIHLEEVSFAYGDGEPVLRNVSLTVPQGQTVAIVGENGAGKSTLVKLLLRFYDPTSGAVRVGGPGERVDLRDLDVTAWRGQVAAVFQDFARFEWTLRENITLGNEGNEARLAEAVRHSGLSGLLAQASGGLETRVGQSFGGIDLSGGQWQKVAVARALYRDARILVLDEPTAALDPRSEAELYHAFAAASAGRTTFLITHRLGSVLMADRILVLKDGRIIEDGTHEELLVRGGEYAELWQLQSRQYASASVDG